MNTVRFTILRVADGFLDRHNIEYSQWNSDRIHTTSATNVSVAVTTVPPAINFSTLLLHEVAAVDNRR